MKTDSRLLSALILALPYVETAEADPAYKPGAVAKVVREMREAITEADQSQAAIGGIAAHTPTPWRIGDNGLTLFGPKTEHPAPVVIAHLLSCSPRVSAAERQANGRLLKAAPEMKLALEKAQNAIVELFADDEMTTLVSRIAGKDPETVDDQDARFMNCLQRLRGATNLAALTLDSLNR